MLFSVLLVACAQCVQDCCCNRICASKFASLLESRPVCMGLMERGRSKTSVYISQTSSRVTCGVCGCHLYRRRDLARLEQGQDLLPDPLLPYTITCCLTRQQATFSALKPDQSASCVRAWGALCSVLCVTESLALFPLAGACRSHCHVADVSSEQRTIEARHLTMSIPRRPDYCECHSLTCFHSDSRLSFAALCYLCRVSRAVMPRLNGQASSTCHMHLTGETNIQKNIVCQA